MNKIIKEYISLVDFFSNIVGNNTEIALHDVTDAEHSLVAISNGHISGREVGAPLNGAALLYIKNRVYETHDQLIDYRGETKDHRPLTCYTKFIKDDGELVGMLCVNIDRGAEKEAIEHLMKVFNIKTDENEPVEQADNGNFKERFSGNYKETIQELFEKVMRHYDAPVTRLTPSEKGEVVEVLNDNGAFLFKGGVAVVAELLSISEASVYRYLQKANGKGEK